MLKKAFIGCFGLLCLAEMLVRLSGITNCATYLVDSSIGYIPKPSQQGVFLDRNHWAFNDRSMGTENPWNPTARPNILLIGNSIIMGGNPYDQKDKLGPLLQQDIGEGYAVWPIAAGGWTNVNETVYLNRNPDVVQAAHYFIWEYMSGGLSGLTEWKENVWPKSIPTFETEFVFEHYLLPRIARLNTNELPRTGSLDAVNLARFEKAVAALSKAAKSKEHGLLFFYPKKAEYLSALQGNEWLPERAELERVAHANGLKVVDISRAKEWNERLYRDDGVHPTKLGNAVLAGILAEATKMAIAR